LIDADAGVSEALFLHASQNDDEADAKALRIIAIAGYYARTCLEKEI
jgi:hypothetical protein